MIIYTSGTTGRPKGVVSTHENIGAQIASLVEAWAGRRPIACCSCCRCTTCTASSTASARRSPSRATCEILPAFDAEKVWERLASGEITVFTAVPTIYHRLIASWDAAPPDVQRDAVGRASRRLRLMMSGSAALPVQTLERWREITGHTLLERYGMTEIGMALAESAARRAAAGLRRRAAAGRRRAAGRRVTAATWRAARRASSRCAGRRCSSSTGSGRRRRATRFATAGSAPATSRSSRSGAYRLLGRTSVDIIKTGGFKVSALEIEEVLRDASGDRRVRRRRRAATRTGASACRRPSSCGTARRSRSTSCSSGRRPQLAPYKVPRALQPVAALPRNAMGKVVKPEVAGLFKSR